ncbi:Gfo/Idh/MocA family protein [Dactylosporangium sp. CA-139066]|uniref:Gfo/Idh/MocA family protein n=1 Tax=Dactylosporangium sp. CA-139066 TaxID=3239930 RepID=UPI003D9108AE
MTAPVRLLVVGAGDRGTRYARFAQQSGRARVVAVAEADPARRASFAEEFGIAPALVFDDWARLEGAGERVADAAIVATQDSLHAGPAVLLAGRGYHLLLEKPMAPDEPSATRIADAVLRAGVIAAVCHVLRYTPYTTLLKRLLDEGRIGRLVSVQHLEPVGWWHQAHSFVRGNWRRAADSSPMLLAKSCHDVDWLLYLAGRPVRRVSSFGGLAHFRAEERPPGAASRCLDCSLEPGCAYSAPRLYLGEIAGRAPTDPAPWPVSVLTRHADPAAVVEALRTGPYGRCVYDCDNDVVDHQVVSMELADGATISFTMTAFTPAEQRKTRLFGTHGYIDGDGARVRLVDFRTGEDTTTDVAASPSADHSDGDAALVDAFVSAVATGDPAWLRSDVTTSLDGHRVVWAAEEARRTGTVVSLP